MFCSIEREKKYYHKLSMRVFLYLLYFSFLCLVTRRRVDVIIEGDRNFVALNLFIDCYPPDRLYRPILDWIFSDVYTKFLIPSYFILNFSKSLLHLRVSRKSSEIFSTLHLILSVGAINLS